MRFLILAAALTITACAKEEAAAPTLAAGTYPGGGRDALCIAGQAGTQRAGFVVYGAGDANCSASGRIEAAGGRWTLIPSGDLGCTIPLSIDAGRLSIGSVPRACAYYCGPGVTADGKSFGPIVQGNPAIDLAGAPLC
jgi:hypothetical protein